MYAATIESELDTQSAMDFILGANSKEQRERLTGWIGEIAAYYAAAPVRLGGAKVPHLMPGDSLNLQTAQDTDNGYPCLSSHCCGISLPGWVSRMSNFPGITPR